MARRLPEPIQCLVKQPYFIIFIGGVVSWGADDHALVVGQHCVEKWVFAVPLLGGTVITNSPGE